MQGDQALVLGGGGVAGIAWITGLLTGLAVAGQDVTGADVIIGTSAGATVAAQVGSDLSLDELFARQTQPALQSREIPVELDLDKLAADWGEIMTGVTSGEEMLRRAGAYALAADTVPEAKRRAVIESRLPSRAWPTRRVQLVAVDAETGQPYVFDSQSGAELVDAVAASCAVPGIWPPVTIGGRRYIDGGVRSSHNADLAEGSGRIVIISPLGYDSPIPSPMPLRQVVGQLRDRGSEVIVMVPDQASARPARAGGTRSRPAARPPARCRPRARRRRPGAASPARTSRRS